MGQIQLPADLAALYAVLANPIMAPVWLSMLLEQTPFIQNQSVANWKKMLASLLVGLLWSIFVSLGNPDGGFAFTAGGIYAIVRAGLSVTFLMNVWNKAAEQGLPWLSDFLLTLFKRTTISNTVVTDGKSATVSSASTVTSVVPPSATPTVAVEPNG